VTARRRGAALLLCVALAGCTSSAPAKDGPANDGPAKPGGTQGAAHRSTRPTLGLAAPVNPVLRRFAARMRAGVAAVRSTHIDFTTRAMGEVLHSAGDEILSSAAVPDRLHLSEQVPGLGDAVELIVIGPAVYARLPAAVYRTESTWLLISSSSPTPEIRQLAATISSARVSASLELINQFVGSAVALRHVGGREVAGTPTDRYTLTVATDRLPAGLPARAALKSMGMDSIPVDIDLDRAGRPVRVAETVETQGQIVSTEIVLTHINEPVTITAPPADEVGTR
jgi:hypothetical protein